MKLLLTIYLKDLRALRYEITVLFLLIAANAVSAAGWGLRPVYYIQWTGMIASLTFMAQAFLALSVVHVETPANEQAWWLARPYPAKTLIAAKLLFAATVIHLPMLLGDMLSLTLLGFSAVEGMAGLWWRNLWVALLITLPAMAVSSISARFAQMGFWVLVVLAGQVAREQLRWTVSDWFHPVELEWSAAVARYLIAGAIAFAVLVWQYRRRRVAVGQMLLAGGILLFIFNGSLLAGRLLAKVESVLTPLPAAHAAVRLELPPSVPFADEELHASARLLTLRLRLSGLSPDERLRVDHLDIHLRGVGDPREVSNFFTLSQSFFSNGELWLKAGFDPAGIASLAGRKLSARGEFTATIVRLGRSFQVPPRGVETTVPGLGRCVSDPGPGRLTLCLQPFGNEVIYYSGTRSDAVFPVPGRPAPHPAGFALFPYRVVRGSDTALMEVFLAGQVAGQVEGFLPSLKLPAN